MLKKIKKNRINKGFSVVEIIVSVSIISLLSAIFLTNYHATNNNTKVLMAAQKLASDIRVAQSYALGIQDNQGNTPEMGWGVYLGQNADNYIIFANEAGDYLRNTDGSEDVNIIKLPSGIEIISSDADILFLPPDPITLINSSPNANVNIILSDGLVSKTVRVNFFGLIEVY
jgi:prepilin-type N-terminal cleavage/methylation domain-containing protein